nr:E3 ubiquitin protein ligase DRIP2-like [Ipomoea batatas]
MSNQVVKVRRETIGACMTCPLCNKLFRDATTISECLHTFCRRCIYKKLSDEETECCPICNIDLGCVPLEKLRADHNLQDVRAKIFPYKRRKVMAPEVVPSVMLPVKRKERSLSSLVVNTPRVSTQSGMTGRRSKSVARKSLRGSSFSIEKPMKKEEANIEDQPESSNSPETLNKFTQNVRQNTSNAEPSNLASLKETDNGIEQWDGKVDLWKPLNCLVEAANRSKSSRFMSQGSAAKPEPPHASDNDGHVRKSKVKEQGQKFKVQYGKSNDDPNPPESEKPKKLRRVRKKEPTFGNLSISPQAVLDAVSTKCERRISPIWFSLVASEDQNGDEPLPQISASYLRIKDGNIPVSFIQKYLMRKLDLTGEDEVEIRCMGQAIVPTLQLNNLVDSWLQMTSSERVPVAIGSSAKDFVMVLYYGRKALAS